MEERIHNLDDWKNFVLKELIARNESSEINCIWKRLKVEFKIPENDSRARDFYLNNVVKCLEIEHKFVRTVNNKEIHLTTLGKQVALSKSGFCGYIQQEKCHKTIKKWNDYIQFATSLLAFASGIIAFLNLVFDWWNKNISVIIMGIIIVIAAVSFIYKKIK